MSRAARPIAVLLLLLLAGCTQSFSSRTLIPAPAVPRVAGAVIPLQCVPTGKMSFARAYHTATLLSDGRVLVVGGADGFDLGSATSAELYDPVTGRWSLTSNLTDQRVYHTATLLPNGQVLVAGGYATHGLTAELYDPSTGVWSRTGSVSVARAYNTATLLPNGKVLVAGESSPPTNTAELYDPTTGTWSTTDPEVSPVGRGATATLLPDGRVLVTGGALGNPLMPTAAVELYDPTTNTWTGGPPMSVSRAGHTATLLPSGQVLVVGEGATGSVGPGSPSMPAAELFDPMTESWTATAGITDPRTGHTATLLPNGLVFVAGGFGRGAGTTIYEPTPSTELYNPATEEWTGSGSLSNTRVDATATLLQDGRVLLAGSSLVLLNTAEICA